MTSPRSIIVAGLVAVLGGGSAVALSACNTDDVFGGNDDDGKVNVSLTERDLDPGRVDVDDGKVEFEVKNDGKRLHAFAVETTDGVKRISEIRPGDTENLIVNLREGRYRMYDPRGGYRERGVRGEVIVTDDDSTTVRERTVQRTVVDEEPDVVVPETDEPEVQEPEVQEQPAPPPPPPPPPPQVVTQTVVAPPPPAEEVP
jgi:hypothetical protein